MLSVVVILFVVCWSPIQLFNVITWLNPHLRPDRRSPAHDWFVTLYFSCHWLFNAHSFMNPIVYCFMNDNFREDLKAMLQSWGFKCCGIDQEAGGGDALGHSVRGSSPRCNTAVGGMAGGASQRFFPGRARPPQTTVIQLNHITSHAGHGEDSASSAEKQSLRHVTANVRNDRETGSNATL